MTAIKDSEKSPEPSLIEHGYGNRFQGFQNLMRYRIKDILLVSGLYDLYLFEEDGRLYELLRNEYQIHNLSNSPELTRVSNGHDAIRLAKEEGQFDLIIVTLHLEDMYVVQFGKMAKEAGIEIPIILLAHDNKELQYLLVHHDTSMFKKIFVWQGDFRIIIAIIKYLEDMMNIDHDTNMVGVHNILLIEDNIKYYSYFLPILYFEIINQSRRLISEGINLTHKLLRMRARPKIILCSTYEEAKSYYKKYKENILGIISDIDFPQKGFPDPEAGLKFTKKVKSEMPDIPILLLSDNPLNENPSYKVGGAFIVKDSPRFFNDLRLFMNQYFSFGDFIFRDENGTEVGRANDLKSLEKQLAIVPDESIVFHAERNHFSNWLKARTEFWLAHKLRPRKISDFPNVSGTRNDLISSLKKYRALRQRGIIADFDIDIFDQENSIARIGGGSLGGKARGLGFVNTIINDYGVRDKFENVKIHVPAAVVLGTDVFDQFLKENDLKEFAINCKSDEEITQRFLDAERFPTEIIGELAAFLEIVHIPLAVRSSSLLEDSQYHPFAGIYETYMIPNKNPNNIIRLNELLTAIKRVYASTFYQCSKEYIRITSYNLEEEKMAVIIQKMVGETHENRFYPDYSGVGKSYNFYPHEPQTSDDGIVNVALGLGKTVVEGGQTVRFCPKFPTDILQFSSVKETLGTSQKKFYALQLDATPDFGNATYDKLLKEYDLEYAEKDGTLFYSGSTYSPDNDAIYDEISRPGPKVVTFGPILRKNIFPLAEMLELLLDMGAWGMGTHVEIEFAVNMGKNKYSIKEFGLLQVRPILINRDDTKFDFDKYKKEKLICKSDHVLGHGSIEDLHDIIFVDYHKFERGKSREVAREVSILNSQLQSEGRRYLLIGVGRWGTLDPWLGIPIRWENIAGARAIIESDFKDMAVTPSQGTHFFQNLTSLMIGYFTVNSHKQEGFIDWEWLLNQKPLKELTFARLLRFDKPLIIHMDGHEKKGIILKPEVKNV